MSTATDDIEYTNVSHDPGHAEHPSDAKYVKVALFLAVVTGLEVSTYFFDLETGQLLGLLIPMMIIKFFTVILYFMHLKYDNPLFKRVFLFGLILAVIVFMIMMTTFNYWWDDYFRFLTRG